jgi:antibiotic biosynthesis monooxygenase (ABM) superfamily enzyme
MFVITRHTCHEQPEFLANVKKMVAVLAKEPGFIEVLVGRSPDDAQTLIVVQKWDSIGNARRGLNSGKNRMDVWPVMSSAQDEPTMFETLFEFKDGFGTDFESVLNQN